MLRAAKGERSCCSRLSKDCLSSCKSTDLDAPIFYHLGHELVVVDIGLSESFPSVSHIRLQDPVLSVAKADVETHIVQLAQTGCVDSEGDALVRNVVKTYGGALGNIGSELARASNTPVGVDRFAPDHDHSKVSVNWEILLDVSCTPGLVIFGELSFIVNEVDTSAKG